MKKTLSALIIAAIVTPAPAGDGPHWLGPNRTGASPETGLLKSWPKNGPAVLWKQPGGGGYSSVVIAGGRAITQVQHDGNEYVLALDAAKGTKLWETKVAPAYTNNYGDGPRSTPTIEGKFVYTQSVQGQLTCLTVEKR